MLEFLINNGINESDAKEYHTTLSEEKYDSIEDLKSMSEDDVRTMCADGGIVAKNHIRKVVAGWKDLTQEAQPSLPPPSTEVPKEIKALLVPNPINEKQEYCNTQVMNIWENCNGKVRTATLFSYARDQRESRYDIEGKCLSLEQYKIRFESSKDGTWINIRSFSKKELTVTHKNLARVASTSKWLANQIANIEVFIAAILEKKRSIQSLADIKVHKLDEINFLSEIIKNRQSAIEFLADKKNIMDASMKGLGSAVHGMAEVSEQKHNRKRELENKNRNNKELIKRHWKMAVDALKVVGLKNEDIISKVRGGNFVEIKEEWMDFGKAAELLPRYHLPGLNLLHAKGFFGEETNLARKVKEQLILMLETKESENQKKSAKISKKKKVNDPSQRKITTWRKVADE